MAALMALRDSPRSRRNDGSKTAIPGMTSAVHAVWGGRKWQCPGLRKEAEHKPADPCVADTDTWTAWTATKAADFSTLSPNPADAAPEYNGLLDQSGTNDKHPADLR